MVDRLVTRPHVQVRLGNVLRENVLDGINTLARRCKPLASATGPGDFLTDALVLLW